MNDRDFQSVKEVAGHPWWALMKERLQKRVTDIEKVLLLPTNDDMLGKNELENIRLLNYKKAERIYLLELIDMPEKILGEKIDIDKANRKV